jgi:membrane-bound lytic murein transglycosylase MltF
MKKKTFPLVILFLFCLVSSVCSPSEPGEDEVEAPVTSEAVGTSTQAASEVPQEEDQLIRSGNQAAKDLGFAQPWKGDFDGMVERRHIRALVTYSNTYYFLDGPRQRGVAYEAFSLFEDWLNKELGTGTLKMHVLIIPVRRDQLLPALVSGRGDIAAAGLTITPERQKLVDFSIPLVKGVDEIVITSKNGPELSRLEDLSGKEVYVRTSSSYFESLTALNESFEKAGRPPMTLTPAKEHLEDEDLLEMVNADLLDIVVVDKHKAELWSNVFTNLQLRPDLAVRTGGQLAWAVRKNTPKLLEMVNRFGAAHKQGTLHGNIIIKKYFETTKWVENALSDQGRERYRETIDFFKKYADQYGFDFLMMVAQGYQESRLDQSLVSPRGAVGIMQLLPSTAADKSVGIPEIHVAENNVHAGIKYMRWIRETYFNDDSVDDVNKTLFSFASYNAGPNRIARLRRNTAERGLDPNVWFDNVEIIASEEIGRETVQYVSNIYKYYAVYYLLTEQDKLRKSGDGA